MTCKFLQSGAYHSAHNVLSPTVFFLELVNDPRKAEHTIASTLLYYFKQYAFLSLPEIFPLLKYIKILR